MNKENIKSEIRKRGNENFVSLCRKLLSSSDKFFLDYGRHTQRDKGRDLVLVENDVLTRIVQCKHKDDDRKLYLLSDAKKEFIKTLLYLVIDYTNNNVNYLNEDFNYTLMTNLNVQQSIIDFHTTSKNMSSREIDAIVKMLQHKYVTLSNSNIHYEIIKDKLYHLVKHTSFITIPIENILDEMGKNVHILFEYDDIKDINLAIDEADNNKYDNSMIFIKKLLDLGFDVSSSPISNAIRSYSKYYRKNAALKSNLIFKLGEEKAKNDYINDYYENIIMNYDSTKTILDVSGELSNPVFGKMLHAQIMHDCPKFRIYGYYDKNATFEQGSYHRLIEQGDIPGWM